MINLIRKIFKKSKPVTIDPNKLEEEESNEFYESLTEHYKNIVLIEDMPAYGKFDLPSIRNWITDHPAQSITKLDHQVDDFLQMFCISLCTYFGMDFNEIRNISDFKNRLAFYNDQGLVRKFEYNVMNKLYCLAEASYPDHYESLCNCHPPRLMLELQEALRINSQKQLKKCLLSIEESSYGFQHMILAYMNEGGRDTWMFNR